MKSSRKPIHKSKWRNIVAFDTDFIKVFKLTNSGRLTFSFGRGKPRSMDELIQSLNNKTENVNQKETVEDIKINLNQESDPNLELLDHSSFVLDSFDPSFSLEFLELNM